MVRKTLTKVGQALPMRQLMIYVGVGLVAVTSELSSFYVLRTLGLSLAVTNICARTAGGVVAFMGNRAFTFSRPKDERRAVGHEALRYLLLFCFLTALSTTFISLLTSALKVPPATLYETATKLGVEIVVVSIGFVIQKFWVFKPTPAA